MSFKVLPSTNHTYTLYHGVMILLPQYNPYKWIATDENGETYMFVEEPEQENGFEINLFRAQETDTYSPQYLGNLEYKGDWRDSLIKIDT